MDTSYNEQLKYQEYSTLNAENVPLTSGYHADLLSTLRHEAPVLCVRFTCNSELVALSDTNVDQSANSIEFMVDVSIGELRRLIAHGLALPRLLESLIRQFHDIDRKQLESNMRRKTSLMVTFDPETWWQDWHHPSLNNESDEDSYDEENDEFGVRSSAQPKRKGAPFYSLRSDGAT
ncbi:hypothetical protein BASA50_006207 [Batrachochytrium salamandrivorans]|uniref:GSKIP domain-containing protein n=1 Tax=Batrachochytrium salamandrivorans TaxID=1357716 RepID=A0ABQ8FAM9_9FUNG|nr:hypothetical protein BASA50_006207 [Batrachochytrium salamandrivorans]